MMRLFVSGLILTTCLGQITSDGSDSCCDSRTESCQRLIQECMLLGRDVNQCQNIACPLDSTFTPKPSSQPDFTPFSTFKPSPAIGGGDGTSNTCCDGTTDVCKKSISMCLATTGNPSICERMACPSPGASPYPTPRQCCDGKMLGCQLSYQGCMNETRNADMCGMIICPVTDSTQAPTMPPIPSMDIPSRPPLPSVEAPSRPPLPSVEAPSRPPLPSVEAPSRPPVPSVEAPSRPPVPSVEAPSRLPIPSVEAPSRLPVPSIEAPSKPPVPTVEAPSKQPVPSIPIRQTQRPSPSAFPTMFIKPLFSPMPSKLPKRSVAPTNFVMPERLPAALTFPKANLTVFKKPEKIQEIQAKLACALRLPLEKIEIRNITLRKASGLIEVLDIDVSVARLSSNGSTNCMVFSDDSTAQQPRSLRQLQGSQDSVVVSYDIVSPPEEIATSSSNDLNTAITGDASLMAFANSVGSTSMSAEVSAISSGGGTGATGATGPSTQNEPNAMTGPTNQATSSINTVGIGVGVAAGALAMVGIGVALTMYQKHKRRVKKAIQSTPPVDIVKVNPVRANSVNSARTLFNPSQARV